MENKCKIISFFDESEYIKIAFERAYYPIAYTIGISGNKLVKYDKYSNSDDILNSSEIPTADIVAGYVADKKLDELMILNDYITNSSPKYFLIESEFKYEELKLFPALQGYQIFSRIIEWNEFEKSFYYMGIRSDLSKEFSLLKSFEVSKQSEMLKQQIWNKFAEQVKTLFPPDITQEKTINLPYMEDNMERRFDVFVSSTYEDLIEERKEVTQAILESDCVPVGMEMFPASNLEQWKFIKKVIEQSDFYLVIIAGKYGSMGIDESGRRISYTEMEFDYAVKLNKPVLVFMQKDPGELKRTKTELSEEKMELLNRFRIKAGTDRLIKYYMNKDELKAGVLSSLNALKKQVNYGGWIRAAEAEKMLRKTPFTGNNERQKKLELKASLLEKQVQELKEALSKKNEEILCLDQKFEAAQQCLSAHQKSQNSIKQAIAMLEMELEKS